MILRLASESQDERSVTVASAAERLGCDASTVYELLRKRLLAGIRIGKTDEPSGVRVKMWSIEAWEERHAIGGLVGDAGEVAAPRPRHRRSQRNAADAEADAALKRLGA